MTWQGDFRRTQGTAPVAKKNRAGTPGSYVTLQWTGIGQIEVEAMLKARGLVGSCARAFSIASVA